MRCVLAVVLDDSLKVMREFAVASGASAFSKVKANLDDLIFFFLLVQVVGPLYKTSRSSRSTRVKKNRLACLRCLSGRLRLDDGFVFPWLRLHSTI